MKLTLPDSDKNAPGIPPVAFMHRTAPGCVSTDPKAYTKPFILVKWDDVADQVDWVEKGICEWRDEAMKAFDELTKLRLQKTFLLSALQEVADFHEAARVKHKFGGVTQAFGTEAQQRYHGQRRDVVKRAIALVS